MKLTIVPSDGAVYKDGYCLNSLNLVGIPTNIHALQWNGSKCSIEFTEDENFYKPENQVFDELPDWAFSALQKWEEAKIAEDLAKEQERIRIEALKAEIEANLAATTQQTS